LRFSRGAEGFSLSHIRAGHLLSSIRPKWFL
jgi:hypothetical protein